MSLDSKDLAYFQIEDGNNDNDDDVNNELIRMPRECHQNIYNAFLILNYREDLKLKENIIFNREMKIGLGALSYITAMSQWAAMIFLTRLVMISSGDTYSEYIDGFTIWPESSRTLFTLPFFIIATITMFKEGSESFNDLLILKTWNIENNLSWRRCNKSWKEWQVFFFKVMTEQILGYIGSCCFFFVIAVYSNINEWNDILNTILNLLAYQFILDADEYTYNMIETIIQSDLAQTLPHFDFDDLFKGYISKKKKLKIRGTIQIRALIIVFTAGMMQSSYSRSWILLFITLSISILASLWIIIWGNKRLLQKDVLLLLCIFLTLLIASCVINFM